MFSYLRPHHKRIPSNPSSPADSSRSFDYSSPSSLTYPVRFEAALQDSPTATSPPPSLPQIARVSSPEANNEGSRTTFTRTSPLQHNWESDGSMRSSNAYALSNKAPSPHGHGNEQRPETAGYATTRNGQNPQMTRGSAPNSAESQRANDFAGGHKYVAATNIHSTQASAGRRPNGSRMPSPPPMNVQSTFEASQPRSGKARLNLLNPMSLLARRRTAQAGVHVPPEVVIPTRAGQSNFSVGFDPRIRGTVIHDFSAPRPPPRNTLSPNDVGKSENGNHSARKFQRSPNLDVQATDVTPTSPWSGGNHTPVFTEDFEEEQYPAAGPHVRKASDFSDLHLPKLPYAKDASRPVDQQGKSNSREEVGTKVEATRKLSDRKPLLPPSRAPPIPPKNEVPTVPRRVSLDPIAIEQVSAIRPSKSKEKRPTGVSEIFAKDGIPKHMKSTSSRFSFDMIGAAEQERVLEDRHRQKALEKQAQAQEAGAEADFDEDYDFDNMDDDDGLEERIPGVNADLEDEDDIYEEPIPGINTDSEDTDLVEPASRSALDGFTFQNSSLGSPLSPGSPGMVGTPRDANGEVIGFALTKNSPQPRALTHDSSAQPNSTETATAGAELGGEGLGLYGVGLTPTAQPEEAIHRQDAEATMDQVPQSTTLEDDELYFDDGLIGGPGDSDDAAEFDESVFDHNDTDQYGRPLRPLSSIPTLYSPPMLTSDPSPLLDKVMEMVSATRDSSNPITPSLPSGRPSVAPQPSISGHHRPAELVMLQNPGTLTQDSLAAYQSALAAAAFAAAANGKFRRPSTVSNNTIPEIEDHHPSLIPDSAPGSQRYEPFSPSYEVEDDFDYDDALEDDAIIDAANAEALANDCDGFYGQEFGFYSAPSASEATYANGGYFGPRGMDGINRSQSGRVVSREPNLTPITERSEYSNRNSFMSMHMHGSGSITSPGLAHLAGMMRSPDYDGDMSLDALLKLRRGAWGGGGSDQASLHSSTGSPRSAGGLEDVSPVGQAAPWRSQGHGRKNSNFSIVDELDSGVPSEYASRPDSPTLTMNIAALDMGRAPDDREIPPAKSKHRYTGSAESISYSKEEDPVEGERWILERRRTAESGEVQLLGREIVSGGRI